MLNRLVPILWQFSTDWFSLQSWFSCQATGTHYYNTCQHYAQLPALVCIAMVTRVYAAKSGSWSAMSYAWYGRACTSCTLWRLLSSPRLLLMLNNKYSAAQSGLVGREDYSVSCERVVSLLAVSDPLIADRLCLPSLIQSALLLRSILMGCSVLASSLLASSLVSTSSVKRSHLSTIHPTHCHLSPHLSLSLFLFLRFFPTRLSCWARVVASWEASKECKRYMLAHIMHNS